MRKHFNYGPTPADDGQHYLHMPDNEIKWHVDKAINIIIESDREQLIDIINGALEWDADDFLGMTKSQVVESLSPGHFVRDVLLQTRSSIAAMHSYTNSPYDLFIDNDQLLDFIKPALDDRFDEIKSALSILLN